MYRTLCRINCPHLQTGLIMYRRRLHQTATRLMRPTAVNPTTTACSVMNEFTPAFGEDEEDAMATAISSVAPSLTPTQEAAREFWRQAGADGMPPFYVISQYYAQLSANSDNLPAVTAAIEQLLTGLGYATDVDTVFA